MSVKSIAIAGGTGFLGSKIVNHLLTIPTVTKITILGRSTSSHNIPPSLTVSIVAIQSYDDSKSLTSALRGHDLLISTLGNMVVDTSDPLLVSAAIDVGVKRFMPSEYTLDVLHPEAEEIAGSKMAAKIATAKQIQVLADLGKIEYTTLVTGAILDWWFDRPALRTDLRGKKMVVFDGGEKKMTGCTGDFIAGAVGAFVKEEKVARNRRTPIAEVEFTCNKLLQTFDEVIGGEWAFEEKSTDALLVESKEAEENGHWRKAYVPNVLKPNFDGNGVGYFEEGFKHRREVPRRSLKDIV
jgi:uncharacterized protein YbjT (DUF2867 family)